VDALYAAMLLPQPKAFPDHASTTLDEVFTVRVLVDAYFLSPVVATVSLNEAVDRRFGLKLPFLQSRSNSPAPQIFGTPGVRMGRHDPTKENAAPAPR
jgi:hypothetical protein